MVVLRCAMVEAGVEPALVYKKFQSNDGLPVTPLQACIIAEKLTIWLKGKKLAVSLNEPGDRWAGMIEELAEGLDCYIAGAPKTTGKLSVKGALVRIDKQWRQYIQEFADFCAKNRGFRVR